MKFWLIVLVLFVLMGTIRTCIRDNSANGSKSSASSVSQPSPQPSPPSAPSPTPRHGITRDQVIRETKIALDLAQKQSGVRATGFAADHCIIGEDKAVCHFHCYVNGVRHIGGIGFDIRNGKLIPSGEYYLDADL